MKKTQVSFNLNISTELPLNYGLPFNTHSRPQYTSYVRLKNTPTGNTLCNVIPLFSDVILSSLLILTTDSPFGAHSNRNDSLARNNLKAKHLWMSPVLSPGPCRGRYTLGHRTGMSTDFKLKKNRLIKNRPHKTFLILNAYILCTFLQLTSVHY